jgi:hypothetical protein
MDRDVPEPVERLPWDAPRLTQLDLDRTQLDEGPANDGYFSVTS